ncbi:acyl-CoA mutase large subunit family protein [Bacillus sp. 165]|uniref:acyl-CoA mutase large subunit family protein n=1 Tax=Bacillus sp. 165 TaxID=1529117 RepID=UPI001ADC1D7A|nr:acyl-CoA mutase large subunit family protein [Bacillus sp. 165]MBO9129736.1 acyl-CoA mutase large subunit family protein [Bacillus sp. 165]
MSVKDTFQEFRMPDYQEWETLAEKTLKGRPFDTIVSELIEQIQLKPLYTKEDVSLEKINNIAGLFPKETRGIAQELWGKDSEAANRVIRDALEHGQTVLHIVLDHATLQGKDSDKVAIEHVVNKGISLNCKNDFESVFNNIPITAYPLMAYAGFTSVPLLSLLFSYVKERGVAFSDMFGSLGADPLAYLAGEGKLPMPLETCYDDMAVSVKWTKEYAPNVRTIFIKTDTYHNAGANAVQEVAFAIATAAEYVRECLKRNIAIDDICDQFTFIVSAGNHLFTEISKFRAIRVVWKKIAEAFGASADKQTMLLHARTSSRTKTAYDPYVNMLRATTEAFSAIVGGADSLHVSTFDEVYETAENHSNRWARNIQHILHGEAHVSKVIDAAGGSYYVEALTETLAQKAWELFQAIEQRGGMSKALKDGFIQEEIKSTAKKRYEKVTGLHQKIIGTNIYIKKDEQRLKVQKQKEKQQRIEGIQLYKEQSHEQVLQLGELSKKLALYNERKIDTLIHAASLGVTLGEMMQGMTGEELEVEPLISIRDAQPFEVLREAAEQYEELKGKRPQLVVVQTTNKDAYLTGILEACGFEVFKLSASSIEAIAIPEDAHAIFVDGENLGVSISTVLQKAGQVKVFVVGTLEGEHEQELLQQGITGFIHESGELLPLLYTLHNELEVIG